MNSSPTVLSLLLAESTEAEFGWGGAGLGLWWLGLGLAPGAGIEIDGLPPALCQLPPVCPVPWPCWGCPAHKFLNRLLSYFCRRKSQHLAPLNIQLLCYNLLEGLGFGV